MSQTQTAFSEYLAALRKNVAHGDATEHTHRPALQRLIETIAPGLTVINEARRIACGAPDFTLRRGTVPLAHIETKDIGTPLDEVKKGRGAHGAQFKRYQSGLPNWILTDYLRFDWFVGGQFRKRSLLATVAAGGKLIPIPGGAEEVEHLLRSMLEPDVATVETPRELARLMAGIAHNLRDLIDTNYKGGSHSVVAWLSRWIASFRETLIPELKEDEFADMFAQTLAYGLFAARIQTAKTGAKFSRAEALFAVPKSNPFLRTIFSELGGAAMPDEFDWAVDDLVHLLERADIGRILADFGHETGQNDPIVHFYETFLAAYDPKLREKRGVYYTPEPVVRYIVRSVDSLLKTHFGKPKGLADEETLILDPATGTATFLYFIIEQIRESMTGQRGAWTGYVQNHLLKRIFGFELLMAPYAVAHLKLGLQLEETGYTFREGERLGIYLTNTLEEAAKKSERIVATAISDEANAAAEIKRERPIVVVVGNPPYSGISANRSETVRVVNPGETYYVTRGDPRSPNFTRLLRTAKKKIEITEKTFIGDLLEEYKQVDGVPLGERKQWTNNDYIKFIRFAQWRIQRTGHGVLGFITDNSFLDAPTLRGVRRSLMLNFSNIYVYDLHGKSKKKEIGPGGSKDENVFDIQQGVSILLAVRKEGHQGEAEIQHSELWGGRAKKYSTLNQSTVTSTDWAVLEPDGPSYDFVPITSSTRRNKDAYVKLTSIKDIFVVSSNGIQTSRDSLVVDFDPTALAFKVRRLRDKAITDQELRMELFGAKEVQDYLPGDTRGWSFAKARESLQKDQDWISAFRDYLYRPFDVRLLMYSDYMVDWPRRTVYKHVTKGSLVLSVGRAGLVTSGPWTLCFVSDTICDHNLFFRGSSLNSPLFLYSGGGGSRKGDLFEGRRPNLSRSFLDTLARQLRLAQDAEFGLPAGVSPEDIFHYIYALFHSQGYRAQYAEFLKRDFPRVPLTSSLHLFRALAAKGRELVALHLLKLEDAQQLDSFITTYPVAGSDEVLRIKYDAAKRRVLINDDQYFGEVPAETWTFAVGGYQVCEKWLKDRKGRVLTYEDQQHWQRVVVALTETRRLIAEIDEIIPGWPLA